MRRITVIGTGYVGLVSGACFSEMGNQVICSDNNADKIHLLNQLEIPFYEPGLQELVTKNVQCGRLSFTTNVAEAIQYSDIIYVAVGTPMGPQGQANLSAIHQVAELIGENLNGFKVIVMKSTVPIGTNRTVSAIIEERSGQSRETFAVVSNPEFLREGSAIADCMNMERAIIGSDNAMAAALIEQLHEPFHTQIIHTDPESAEMIKYAANAFLATKISFINEIANLCEKLGANIDDVVEGLGSDSRISKHFLRAGIGYGGSCFPKDTEALRHMAEEAGCELRIVDSVIEVNHKQRYRMISKLEEQFGTGSFNGRTFAVLGLSFKPETNDIRYAPSLDLIPALLELGAKIRAYDPVAIPEVKSLLHEAVTYWEDPYEAIQGCDACLILTEWDEIMNMDLQRAASLMKTPVIIDGRNCFHPCIAHQYELTYLSIGRASVTVPAVQHA